jgi:hypothetical protein
MRRTVFKSNCKMLALAMAGVAALSAHAAPARAACGWVQATNDFLCDQITSAANGPNTATVAIETTRAIPGITAGGNALVSPPLFLGAGTAAVDSPQSALQMTQQMTALADQLAQLGIDFQVIIDAMVPMTEEERAAFMAAVAAMTTVELIATFGG